MKNCWNKEAEARPAFTELHKYFVDLLNGDYTALQREIAYLSSSQSSRRSGTISSSGVSSMNSDNTLTSASEWNSAGSASLRVPQQQRAQYADMGELAVAEDDEGPELFVPGTKQDDEEGREDDDDDDNDDDDEECCEGAC